MANTIFWRKPTFRSADDETKERKASWLELFFDLVFVAVIAELAEVLIHDISLHGLYQFILLFVPTWWIWNISTYYNDRFETNDVIHRLFTFGKMLIIISLALNIHEGLGATSTGFILSYVAVRILLLIMWIRGAIHNPKARPSIFRGQTGVVISIALWIYSIFVPAPQKFIFWIVGILIEYLTPLTTLKLQEKLPRFSSTHLPERFGLFMIIVLGEAVIGIMRGATESSIYSHHVITTSLLGLLLTFGIWWLYFDHVTGRPPKKQMVWQAAWTYAHLPLVMSLTALGAAIVTILMHDGLLSQTLLWLTSASAAIAILMIGLIEITLSKINHTPCKTFMGKVVRFGGAALCVVIALVGKAVEPVTLLLLLNSIVVIQIIQGLHLEPHTHEIVDVD